MTNQLATDAPPPASPSKAAARPAHQRRYRPYMLGLSLAVGIGGLGFLLADSAGFEYYKHVDEVAQEPRQVARQAPAAARLRRPPAPSASASTATTRSSSTSSASRTAAQSPRSASPASCPTPSKRAPRSCSRASSDGPLFQTTEVMAKCPSKYAQAGEAQSRHGHPLQSRLGGERERKLMAPTNWVALFGSFVLLLTLLCTTYAGGSAVAGARLGSRRLIHSSIYATYACCALLTLASAMIFFAILSNDFSINVRSPQRRRQHAVDLQAHLVLGGPRRLDDVLGVAAVDLCRRRRVSQPGAPPRAHAVGGRHPHGDPGVFRVAGGVLQAPLRHLPHRRAAARQGAESAASGPLHGDAPAVAVHRLRVGQRAVCSSAWRRSSPATSTTRGCSRCGGGCCSAGTSCRRGSSSARCGPITCSAGAVTGAGIRWKMPAFCRGLRRRRSSTRS